MSHTPPGSVTSESKALVEPPRHQVVAPKQSIRDRVQKGLGLLAMTLDKICGSRNRNQFGILIYHRIYEAMRNVSPPTINVQPLHFRKQLAGLKERGFRFRHLSTVLQTHGAEPPDPKSIVVTFDDGYENVYSKAWPVLRELQIPATIFINTKYIDTDAPFPFDSWGVASRDRLPKEAYRPLSWEQCREMRDSGLIEFGTHTGSHEDFRDRSSDLQVDLESSITTLREHLGIASVTFAFPYGKTAYGYASPEMREAARRAGTSCALTTDESLVGQSADPFGWGRYNVYDWDSPATIAARLDGWYSWVTTLREWVVRP